MWTRSELKTNAKKILSANYLTPFFASLIVILLTGSNSSGQPGINVSISGSEGSSLFSQYFVIPFIGFGFLYVLLFANPLKVGLARFYMENRQWETVPFGKLFFAFSKPYMNVVVVLFMKYLFVFLWSLLLIIPGIIKLYEYRMVEFILSENPRMDWQEALKLSREMTAGEKFEIFILDLSFIGWMILGVLACGIGIFFVYPYMDATNAELYAKMRQKSFETGMPGSEQLLGFETNPTQ